MDRNIPVYHDLYVHVFFFRSHCTLVFPSLISTPPGRQIPLAPCAKTSAGSPRVHAACQWLWSHHHTPLVPPTLWPHHSLQSIQCWAMPLRCLNRGHLDHPHNKHGPCLGICNLYFDVLRIIRRVDVPLSPPHSSWSMSRVNIYFSLKFHKWGFES